MSDELDTLEHVLIGAITACGGSKEFGHQIWPSKGVDGGARQLCACLNAGRAEKLSLEELLRLASLLRAHGNHALMNYLAQRLHYAEPTPVKPQDLSDQVRRSLVDKLTAIQADIAWLKALDDKPQLRSAA